MSIHDVYCLEIPDVFVGCLFFRISHSKQITTLEAVVVARVVGS